MRPLWHETARMSEKMLQSDGLGINIDFIAENVRSGKTVQVQTALDAVPESKQKNFEIEKEKTLATVLD